MAKKGSGKFWLGEGSLKLDKGVFLKSGQEIPDGALSADRIKRLGKNIGVLPTAPVASGASDKLKSENEDLKSKVTVLTSDNDKLVTENTKLNADLADLSAKNEDLNNRIAALTADQISKTGKGK